MSSMSHNNTSRGAGPAVPATPSAEHDRESGDWTIISKPGAAVEISTRPMPDRVREAISRNMGIGTGVPDER